jgi:twitching motility two-component system response regulator PilG
LSAAGKVGASLERWNEAIAVSGGDVEVWLGLAATTEDQDEAARAIQSAQAIDADDPRIAAALDWLHGPQVDPSVLPAPGDAFARFEAPVDSPSAAADDQLDDFLLDELATLPQAEPTPAPSPVPAAAAEPVAINGAALEPAAERVAEPIVEPAAEPAAEPVAAPPEATVAAVAADAATIMVVDDSPTIRKILTLTLERAGYRVFAEPDGHSALERLQEVVPRVVLLDIAMPDLDGYEVCKRIKQDPRTGQVPVIMLSGKGAFFDKVKGHMAGATEYLTKPFETPAVLAIVTSHCQAEAHHG